MIQTSIANKNSYIWNKIISTILFLFDNNLITLNNLLRYNTMTHEKELPPSFN